ncbi:MAG: outer membrane lipoprotein carrier protein LolA [Spirochaetales bacterium]|nr:outer membrane lipoprotein carrier protein LolA [Spirochaetales bacterium]
MSRLIFALFILTFASLLGAQDIMESPVTEETRPRVNGIFSELASHELMRADYTQAKYIAALDRELPGSGVFLFHGERGMAWMVEKPFPMELVINDRELIQRSRSGQSQTLSFEENPSFHGFSQTVQAIFRGDYDEVDRQYEIFFDSEGEGWEMALVPRDSSVKALIASFVLKGETDLEEFVINESTGDRITYQFFNISYPEQFSDGENRVLP